MFDVMNRMEKPSHNQNGLAAKRPDLGLQGDVGEESAGKEDSSVLVGCLIHDIIGGITLADAVFVELDHLPQREDEVQSAVETGRSIVRSLAGQLRNLQESLSLSHPELGPVERDRDFAPDILASLRHEIFMMAPAFRIKGVTVETNLPPEPGLPVVGNRHELERVLFNLLDNALRHTPAKRRVAVSVRETDQNVLLAVEDEGTGVPDKFKEVVFEKEFRGAQGGRMGLGLHFARLAVANWGGEIGCLDAEGGGARFEVALPKALVG